MNKIIVMAQHTFNLPDQITLKDLDKITLELFTKLDAAPTASKEKGPVYDSFKAIVSKGVGEQISNLPLFIPSTDYPQKLSSLNEIGTIGNLRFFITSNTEG